MVLKEVFCARALFASYHLLLETHCETLPRIFFNSILAEVAGNLFERVFPSLQLDLLGGSALLIENDTSIE